VWSVESIEQEKPKKKTLFGCRQGFGSTHDLLLADIGKPLPSTQRKEILTDRERKVVNLAV
jgi:hypothetical protein